METLGSLCDKLTIIKLKQYHSEDKSRLESLTQQEILIKEEIDELFEKALNGEIPIEKLSYAANKVYKKDGNEARSFTGNLGTLFSELADVNCKLWHEQEHVYEFEKVSPESKDKVVKQLAILNLERNNCIDAINNSLIEIVTKNNFKNM